MADGGLDRGSSLLALVPPLNIGELEEIAGKIIIRLAGGHSAKTETQPLAQALGKLIGQKIETATIEDGRRVLKLSDAIQIVAQNVNGLTEAAELSKWITPLPLPGTTDSLAEIIIQQLRAKALQQNNPERFKVGPHRTRK